jgi:hypothetical protein
MKIGEECLPRPNQLPLGHQGFLDFDDKIGLTKNRFGARNQLGTSLQVIMVGDP